MTEAVRVTEGDGPLVLAFPHVGTWLPGEVRAGLTDEGRLLPDTDWHLDRLYDGLAPGATCVQARFHRYLVDPNRDPSGASLYPGQTTTGLVPVTTFDDVPLWRDGHAPGRAEVARRRACWHAAYHAALAAQIARVRARHGHAVLYDCHSIRSVVPWLFAGTLPDFNIGTDGGRTCAPEIARAVVEACRATGRSHVVNGRFRGGWTTRHYGRPETGVHAVQMELAQTTYLASEAPPFAYCRDRAEVLRPQLAEVLARMMDAAARLPAVPQPAPPPATHEDTR